MKRKRQPQAKQPKTSLKTIENMLFYGIGLTKNVQQTLNQGRSVEVIPLANHRKALLDLSVEKDRLFATKYQEWEIERTALETELAELRKFKQQVQSAINPERE